MTILPGRPIAPPDEPSPPPSKHSRDPRTGVSRRTLALVLAAVVAAGGGGAWFMLHSSGSGGSKPAAAVVTHPVVHHPKPAVPPGKFAAPRTKADAMAVATRIFSVLPAQLPGWQVEGKPTFDTGDDSNDPVSRSVRGCLAAATGRGVGVDSPTVSHTTRTPTYTGVDVTLGFMPSAARAAADLAVLRRPSAQKCLSHAIVGRTVTMGAGATLTFTSMKPLKVPGHAVGMEFDGQIGSDIIGGQSVRVVMLAAADRATEILVTSSGLGAALPLASDVRILGAISAQTRRLIA